MDKDNEQSSAKPVLVKIALIIGAVAVFWIFGEIFPEQMSTVREHLRRFRFLRIRRRLL